MATKPKTANRIKGVDGVTPQQRAFVEAYVIGKNATQAALKAGYSPSTARAQASRLLTNVGVRALLESREAEVIQQVQIETGITLARTLTEIAKSAFFDVRKLFDAKGNPIPLPELDAESASAIAGFEVLEEFAGSGENRILVGYTKKYKLAERKGYLDMLMKHLNGYKEDNKGVGEGQATAFISMLQEISSRGSRIVIKHD